MLCTRRNWLEIGGASLLGLTWAEWLRAEAPRPGRRPQARACVVIFLWGGPGQQDLWDLKPAAPAEVRGEYRPIATRVPGTHISERLPCLARQADKYTIVRSLTHRDFEHGSAAYTALTGHPHPAPGTNTPARPEDFPTYGAVVGRVRGLTSAMPPAVVLGPVMHQGNRPPLAGQNAGFLGRGSDPFRIADDPSDPDFQVEALTSLADRGRLDQRQALLHRLQGGRPSTETALAGMDRHYQRAFELLRSSRVRRGLDVNQEPSRTRDRYGRSRFGQTLLLARRLLEAGVPFLTINWERQNGDQWDTHKANYRKLAELLTAHRNEALGRELASVVRILEGAGIGVIPYKGPTLAVRAYGDPGLREFGDLDLLVRSRDAVRAKQVLQESGYAPTHEISADQERALVRSSRDYELALVNRAHGTMVELHWRADPDAELPPLGDESWWAALPRVELFGQSCATLPTEDLLLVLCVHGSKHFWWSLGWLADVVELARREPADWERIREIAMRHGCARRLAFAISLARDLLDAQFAGATAFPTGQPGVRNAAEMIRGRLFLREDAELAPMTAFRLHAGLCDGPAKAFGLAWRAAFTPGWSEWERWRLPARLFFLYRILRPARLLAKYALRLGAREAHLAPGLEHGDRDGVGEVQAAIPGTHRQP